MRIPILSCLLFLTVTARGQSLEVEDAHLREQLEEGELDLDDYQYEVSKIKRAIKEAGGYPTMSTDSIGRYVFDTTVTNTRTRAENWQALRRWLAAEATTAPGALPYFDESAGHAVLRLVTSQYYEEPVRAPIGHPTMMDAAPGTVSCTLEVTVADGGISVRVSQPLLELWVARTFLTSGANPGGATTAYSAYTPSELLPLSRHPDRFWEMHLRLAQIMDRVMKGMGRSLASKWGFYGNR